MRSLICLSLLAAAALGACSQSLTGNMSGTGGSGTGAGGIVSGTGGAGGVDLASLCGSIATHYEIAIGYAQTCDGSQPGQCEKLIDSALSTCGSCPTYVNDSSGLLPIQQAWLSVGCDKLPPVPCAKVACSVPANGVCLSGKCVAGPSGTGGSSPDAGPNPSACDALVQKYATVLSVVKRCTVDATGQCSHPVPQTLTVCFSSCMAYVNDETELNAIQQAWNDAGCSDLQVACPAIACLPSSGGLCLATDGGSATCTPIYSVL
jgi:hypothetical protein